MLCSIEGCDRKAKYKKTGWCQTHYHRWWRQGDPEKVGSTREENPYELKYRSVHARNVELWGTADQYCCITCGSPAHEWSYDGTDPTEKYELLRGKYPVRFSVHPEFYVPLCYRCHRFKDRGEWSDRRRQCSNGHELTLNNIYTRPSRPGTKECKTCKAEESKKRYRRRTSRA